MRQAHAVKAVSGRSGDGLSWPFIWAVNSMYRTIQMVRKCIKFKEFNDEWDEEEGAVKDGSGGQDSMISQMLMNKPSKQKQNRLKVIHN